MLSIIGPSGSGKSTLLRCATLLTRIDGGEISYMGKKAIWTENGKVCMPSKNEIKDIQSCFGLVFQNFNLFPHFTVMKNITDAPIHVQKRNKDEVYKEARELLAKDYVFETDFCISEEQLKWIFCSRRSRLL